MRGRNQEPFYTINSTDKFYIVAFPQDLELCCLFMKPQGIDTNIKQLNKIASRITREMDLLEDENDIPVNSDEDTIEEMKRLIVNHVHSGVKKVFQIKQFPNLESNVHFRKLFKSKTRKKARKSYFMDC